VQDPQTGQLIGTGRKIGRLYELTELHIPHESNICVVSAHSSIQLWQLIGTRCKIGKLYELTELHIPHESNICLVSTHSSIQLWHRRLAHSSIGAFSSAKEISNMIDSR
jgi:hypothetical protein